MSREGLDERAGSPATEVVVNGEARSVAASTMRELLAELGLDAEGRGVAIARDGEIVPRGSWSTTRIGPGDRIEIVGAVQGG